MYIYYCPNCNGFDSFDTETGEHLCPSCNKLYLPLQTSVEDWNNMSNDEMLSTIERAKKPAIKIPDFDKPIEQEGPTAAEVLTNENNEYFSITKVSSSKRGNFSADKNWFVTGTGINLDKVCDGLIVDIYDGEQLLIDTLPIASFVKIGSDITVKFKDKGQYTILSKAHYIVPHGYPLPSINKTPSNQQTVGDRKDSQANFSDMQPKYRIVARTVSSTVPLDYNYIHKYTGLQVNNEKEVKNYMPFLVGKNLLKSDAETLRDNIKQAGLVATIEPDDGSPLVFASSVSTRAGATSHTVKCPYCGSDYCEKLGLMNKSASLAFWGLASNKIGKQWKCKNCGSMF